MKSNKAILTLIFIFFSLNSMGQIKTDVSNERITINSLKLGYIYTKDQIIATLGQPTEQVKMDTEFGSGFKLSYGDDYVLYDDRESGLNRIVLRTNKFYMCDEKLRVGENISVLSRFKNTIKKVFNPTTIYLYLGTEDSDPIIINHTNTGIIKKLITSISW